MARPGPARPPVAAPAGEPQTDYKYTGGDLDRPVLAERFRARIGGDVRFGEILFEQVEERPPERVVAPDASCRRQLGDHEGVMNPRTR